MSDALSLNWYVRVLRPCGWKTGPVAVLLGTGVDKLAIDGRLNRSVVLKSTSLLKSTGARLPPARTSFWSLDEAIQRHAPTKRCACDSVKASGRGSVTRSRSVRSSVSLM